MPVLRTKHGLLNSRACMMSHCGRVGLGSLGPREGRGSQSATGTFPFPLPNEALMIYRCLL